MGHTIKRKPYKNVLIFVVQYAVLIPFNPQKFSSFIYTFFDMMWNAHDYFNLKLFSLQ